MITKHALRATMPKTPGIVLAPFGVEELTRVLPLDSETLQYEVTHARTAFGKPPQQVYKRTYMQDLGLTAWGIYLGQRATTSFIGTVGTIEIGDRVDASLKYSQEVGTIIFDADSRGKGIGTLAKLAIVTHAIRHDKTRSFQAYTSVRNVAARKSLEKVGFTHIEDSDFLEFSGGENTREWILIDPPSQERLRDIEPYLNFAAIAKGWKRYEAAAKRLKITAA